MNWLSQEEIKRRAEISDEEALNVSIEHWEQICEAVKTEIKTYGHYFTNECGLCLRYKNRDDTQKHPCSLCLLHKDDNRGCCQEWLRFYTSETLPNAQAMLNRLYLERGKRYGSKEVKKECKKEKPKELRNGDYEIDKNKIPIVWLRDRGDELWPNTPKGQEYPGNGTFDNDFELILGNIFDDLERNSKDLEEFTVGYRDGSYDARVKVKLLTGEGKIQMRMGQEYFTSPIAGFQDFHQRLGQLIATVKRKAKKDC